ncbi:nucleotide exchange factor GrpE [Streptomyces sp. NPDC001530]|uniref:nucleotide exchange factor GrpE n=1 Tax=Streptomyces sp. NPDC001530 TaxID=3364582 RepID=UPI0036AF493F
MNRQSKRQKPLIVRHNRRPDPAPLQPGPQSAAADKPVEREPRADVAAPDVRTTARPRSQSQPEGEARPTSDVELATLRAQLQERTADLQRVKAEYDNYRKRVRRDRLAVGEIAVANVLAGLLPVLDAIDRARDHGAVKGGFRRVVDILETQLTALGLESFGRSGDSFDPAVHDALSHTRTGQVDRPVCTTVHRPGYRVGNHLLRPAQVSVAAPFAEPRDESTAGPGAQEE